MFIWVHGAESKRVKKLYSSALSVTDPGSGGGNPRWGGGVTNTRFRPYWAVAYGDLWHPAWKASNSDRRDPRGVRETSPILGPNSFIFHACFIDNFGRLWKTLDPPLQYVLILNRFNICEESFHISAFHSVPFNFASFFGAATYSHVETNTM